MSYSNQPVECEFDPVFGRCRRSDTHVCACEPAEPKEEQPAAPDEIWVEVCPDGWVGTRAPQTGKRQAEEVCHPGNRVVRYVKAGNK